MNYEKKSLDGIKLFASLTPQDRTKLAERCRWHRYKSQEIIIEQEQDDSDVYFIVQGVIRVVTYGANGREISFADVGEGECIGELSAIDGKPRSAGIVALEPVYLAIMPAKMLMETLKTYPDVALAMLKKITSLLRAASERVLHLSTISAFNRVYSEVFRLAKLSVNNPYVKNVVLSPAPVHTDIAARVSTTRETVARAFGVLARRKIVRRVKGGIEILDMAKLQAIVDEYETGI